MNNNVIKMKKQQIIKKPKETNHTLWIAIVVITVLGGTAYWLYRKRKEKEADQMVLPDTFDDTSQSTLKTVKHSRFRCTGTSYPLAYGTCHKDVELLQRYLKIYHEDLGRSGKHKDGVDGRFGSKTVKAARKRLGKGSFTKKDIEGMKISLKMIKA